jgi:hypothetical protein
MAFLANCLAWHVGATGSNYPLSNLHAIRVMHEVTGRFQGLTQRSSGCYAGHFTQALVSFVFVTSYQGSAAGVREVFGLEEAKEKL